MKNKWKLIIIIMAFLLLIGCQQINKDLPTSSKGNLQVAVSIVPIETFVKAVGGDMVDTTVLIPPGNSPANYAPSPQEMTDLSNASLYFSIGVPTEKANILPKAFALNNSLKIIELDKYVAQTYPERFSEEEEQHEHQGKDPHIWLSPKRVQIIIEIIATELGKLDPENKDIFFKNAHTYKTKLSQLDQHINNILNTLDKKAFLIYHPSLGYFADDFGLKMVAVEEGGKHATIKGLEKIVQYAKKENIKVIFYQAEMDSKQAKIIAQEIGGTAELIEPLAPNYIENLKKIASTLAQTLN